MKYLGAKESESGIKMHQFSDGEDENELWIYIYPDGAYSISLYRDGLFFAEKDDLYILGKFLMSLAEDES